MRRSGGLLARNTGGALSGSQAGRGGGTARRSGDHAGRALDAGDRRSRACARFTRPSICRSPACWRAWSRPAFASIRRSSRRFPDELDTDIQRLSAEIYELAGKPFNINSPQQLGKILFEDLNLPAPVKYGKGKTISTAADVLEGLAEPSTRSRARCSNTASSRSSKAPTSTRCPR